LGGGPDEPPAAGCSHPSSEGVSAAAGGGFAGAGAPESKIAAASSAGSGDGFDDGRAADACGKTRGGKLGPKCIGSVVLPAGCACFVLGALSGGDTACAPNGGVGALDGVMSASLGLAAVAGAFEGDGAAPEARPDAAEEIGAAGADPPA
jgi:hypothetical protein